MELNQAYVLAARVFSRFSGFLPSTKSTLQFDLDAQTLYNMLFCVS